MLPSFLDDYFAEEINQRGLGRTRWLLQRWICVPGFLDSRDGFGAWDRSVEDQMEEMRRAVLTEPSAQSLSLTRIRKTPVRGSWHQATAAQLSELQTHPENRLPPLSTQGVRTTFWEGRWQCSLSEGKVLAYWSCHWPAFTLGFTWVWGWWLHGILPQLLLCVTHELKQSGGKA